MCGKCRCPRICGCNTSCCFGFKIPMDVGYVICIVWLFFNGFAFPLISLVFWPRNYIFWGSSLICLINTVLCCISLANIYLKNHKLFNTVLYGVFSVYMTGGLLITVAVNADIKGNSRLLVDSLQRIFNVTVNMKNTSGILQSTQIVFYTYLFVSYVYCGFILQLYEIKYDKRYRKVRDIY